MITFLLVPALLRGDVWVSSRFGNDSASGMVPGAAVRTLSRAQTLWRKQATMNPKAVHLDGDFPLSETMKVWQIDSNITLKPWNSTSRPRLSGGVPIIEWSLVGAGVWRAEMPKMAPHNASSIFVSSNGSNVIVRRYRVRTKILFWDKPLSWSDTEVSRWGFVYSDGDIPLHWDLSPRAISQWRVVAFHQWSKSYHTVRAVCPRNRTILFEQPAPYYYGRFVNNTASAKRFYIENVAEIPLQAGSGYWRVNSSLNAIFYAPATGDPPPAAGQVVVPSLQRLLSVENAENVTISGVELLHTDVQCPISNAAGQFKSQSKDQTCADQYSPFAGELLFAQNAPGLAVSNCTLAGSGGASATIVRSPGAEVATSAIRSAGGYGVRLTDSPGAAMRDSFVDGAGEVVTNSGGISVVNSAGSHISHNEVSHVRHVRGVSFCNWEDRGANTDISYNHIHHCGCESDECLSDGGAIYGTSTSPSVTPVFVHHNLVHDITARNFGGVGIYLDSSSNAVQVHHNIVYNVADQAVYWHLETAGKIPLMKNAPATRFENNIFIKSRRNANSAAPWHQRPLILGLQGYTNSTFTKNIVYVSLGSEYSAAERLLDGVACAAHFHTPPNRTCTAHSIDTFNSSKWDSNLYYNVSDEGAFLRSRQSSAFAGGALQNWRNRGHDRSSIIDDPLFVSPTQGDYRLQPLSPALVQLGFGQWDWQSPNAVGPDWNM